MISLVLQHAAHDAMAFQHYRLAVQINAPHASIIGATSLVPQSWNGKAAFIAILLSAGLLQHRVKHIADFAVDIVGNARRLTPIWLADNPARPGSSTVSNKSCTRWRTAGVISLMGSHGVRSTGSGTTRISRIAKINAPRCSWLRKARRTVPSRHPVHRTAS